MLCSDGDDKPRTTGEKPGTLSAPQIVLPHSFLGPNELDLFTDSIIDRKSKKHGSRKKVIAGEKTSSCLSLQGGSNLRQPYFLMDVNKGHVFPPEEMDE